MAKNTLAVEALDQTYTSATHVSVGTDWTLAAGETLAFNGDEQEADSIYQTQGVVAEAEGSASILLTVNGNISVGVPATNDAMGVLLSYKTMTALASLVLNGRLDVLAGTAGGNATGVSAIANFGQGQSVVINGTVNVVNSGVTTSDYLAGARGIADVRTLVNNGTVQVRSDHGVVAGVRMSQNDSTFVNTGSVQVDGNPDTDPLGVIAVRGYGTQTFIDNRGTITAVSHSAVAPSIGIYLYPDNSNVYQTGTIYNSGTIIAQTAILATEGHEVALTITNTNRIEGALDRRDGGLDVVTNAAGATWTGNLTLGMYPDIVRNAGTISGSVLLGVTADYFDGTGGAVSGTIDGGGGIDYLRGGAAGDRLLGGDGADLIIGGGGADTLTGGTGADTFAYGVGDSVAGAQDLITDFQTGLDRIDLAALMPASVNLSTSGGTTIVSGTSASGAFRIAVNGFVAQSDIVTSAVGAVQNGSSNSELLVAANRGAQLFGNDGDDTLVGGTGDDLLDGGSGANTMFGGLGNDLYVVRNDGDRLLEAEGAGTDAVGTYVDYSLQAWIENGTILGSAAVGLLGNNLANVLTGNDANNLLSGGRGDDIIQGAGGADTLIGGAGADRFVYTHVGDSVASAMDYLQYFEHGIDKVDLTDLAPTSFSFDEFNNPWSSSHWTTVTIGTAAGTMTIRLDGTATQDDFVFQAPPDPPMTLTGTDGDDTLTGGTGADTLDGLAGNDTLIGSAGDDLLIGGIGDDRIDGGAGFDVAGFSASRSEYDIRVIADHSIRVSGPDGVDRLQDIELLTFADGQVSVPAHLFEQSPGLVLDSFGASAAAGGWSSSEGYPRTAVDLNGDGRADLVGFGSAGVYVALANASGGFGAVTLAYQGFGASDSAGGWNGQDHFPRTLADIDGDGHADLVGFGGNGVFAALGDGQGGFGTTFLAKDSFGYSAAGGGWSSNERYPRALGDVNGDGMADLVGFGSAGVYVSLATGGGRFGDVAFAYSGFGAADSAGGWTSEDRYPRMLADVNGDGKVDLVGFGANGVFAALATGGASFGPLQQISTGFGTADAAGGWISNTRFPRLMADLNGDHAADLIGFGANGAFVALNTGDGSFGAVTLELNSFGAAEAGGGWVSNDPFPRLLADMNGDGLSDIVGFGGNGVFVAHAESFSIG